MPFHSAEHTAGVIRRTGGLLRGMGAPEKECRVGLLAAAFHDTVQRWVPGPLSDVRVLRRRRTGQNEADSAAEAVDCPRWTFSYSGPSAWYRASSSRGGCVLAALFSAIRPRPGNEKCLRTARTSIVPGPGTRPAPPSPAVIG